MSALAKVGQAAAIAACFGKDKLSAFRAYAIAKRMNRRREKRRGRVQAYLCPVCNQHHVGGVTLL